MKRRDAVLVLENGRVFRGQVLGPEVTSIAEVVFNTALSGYQEILTDPSYAGQIVVMTAPQIGNTGINEADMEADKPYCRGLVAREISPIASNWRSESTLPEFLHKHAVPMMDGLDTRALTRELRSEGSMRGAISTDVNAVSDLVRRIQESPAMEGTDWASTVTCKAPYVWEESSWTPPEFAATTKVTPVEFEVVAYDFGIKKNILRDLRNVGCRVTVVPATTSASDVLARKPDGIFLSNGPGDPAALKEVIATISELSQSGTPLFGICLGHQLLALGLGATTYKLPFGHHGGNHPVMDLATTAVDITAHNHGFSVREDSLPDHVRVTHRSLNDNTVEGIALTGAPVFSVQYHPEGGPGPHDAAPLFQAFAQQMRSR